MKVMKMILTMVVVIEVHKVNTVDESLKNLILIYFNKKKMLSGTGLGNRVSGLGANVLSFQFQLEN
jgi:hypothetical protein